jgi:hypothetical protein
MDSVYELSAEKIGVMVEMLLNQATLIVQDADVVEQHSVGVVVAPRPTSPTAWYWRSRVRPGICAWALSIARLARLMARSACRPVYCDLFDSGALPRE